MKIQYVLSLFILFLILSFNSSVNASDQIQKDTLSQQLNRLNIVRSAEPIRTKNELLNLLSNFPESGTKNQLFTAYTILGSSYERARKSDSAYLAFQQARQLLTDDIELANQFDFNISFGRYHLLTQAYDSALFYFEKSVKLAEKMDQAYYFAAAYNGLGNIALDRNLLNKAYEYFLKALRYFEETEDTKNMAIVYNNMGIIMEDMGNYERGIQYYYKALEINKVNNAVFDVSMNYNNLGVIYKELGRLEDAIAVFDSSNKIAEEHGLVMDIARNKLNLGNLYVKTKDFVSAEKSFLESLKLCVDNNNSYGIMLNNNGLSYLYFEKGALEKSEVYAKKSIEIAKQYDETEVLRESDYRLAQIAEKKGQYETALYYRKAYEALNDTMISRANKNLILELQTKYDTEKKELENSALKAENLVKENAIKDQKTINIIISIALIILTLLMFFVYRVSKKLKKANQNLNYLNQKIASQNAVLEETIKTKDKLFSIIAHDLKSPFNSLLGYLQIMIDQKDHIDTEEYELVLNKIYSKSNDTYTLLENLLQWAMNQRGQIAYKPEQHNLFEIVDDEMRFLQSRADKKHIQLITEDFENIQVWCDRDMISTVFRNIINNAIKFTRNNGYVKVTAEVKSDYVFVKISDNGIGMNAELISRIQQSNEFYSLRGTENESGTGLGLKIVRDFLATNQAQFTIDSKPGQGTNFTIRFLKYNVI